MASRTRIPGAEMSGLKGTLVRWGIRRMVGEVPDAVSVMWHNPAVLMDTSKAGRKAEKWSACDPTLKAYAHMAVASLVGCSFCLDLGYYKAHDAGLDERKASQVPRWRTSDAFTALERDVMGYAEAMSATPPTVTDEQVARLHDALGPAALVELTSWVGFANLAARGNVALGIEAHGFSTVCELPLAARDAGAPVGDAPAGPVGDAPAGVAAPA